MPVPKRKRSHSRKNKRNANKGAVVKAFTFCKNCEEVLVPHVVCKSCGHYKGVKIMVTKEERAVKRGKKSKAKQQQAQKSVAPKPEAVATEKKATKE